MPQLRYYKQENTEMKSYELESVGTVVFENGMTYPMLVGGGYDADAGTHVGDIEHDGDWMTNLSDDDYASLAVIVGDIWKARESK